MRIFVFMGFILLAAPLWAAGGNLCNTPVSTQNMTCPFATGIAALPMEDRENHVFFPLGGHALDADARNQLAQLTRVLRHPVMQGTCLRLTGHADSSGNAGANLSLSGLRAQTVANFIMAEMGDTAPDIVVMAVGASGFIDNMPPNSPAQRRVRIDAKPCV